MSFQNPFNDSAMRTKYITHIDHDTPTGFQGESPLSIPSPTLHVEMETRAATIEVDMFQEADIPPIHEAMDECIEYARRTGFISEENLRGEITNKSTDNNEGFAYRNDDNDVKMIKVRGQNMTENKLNREWRNFMTNLFGD